MLGGFAVGRVAGYRVHRNHRWQSRSGADVAPRPLTGSTIKQVLLDGAALSKLLNQPFKAVPSFPPVFGGSEKLGDSYGSASPADCVGVVYMMQKSAYQSANVKRHRA